MLINLKKCVFDVVDEKFDSYFFLDVTFNEVNSFYGFVVVKMTVMTLLYCFKFRFSHTG